MDRRDPDASARHVQIDRLARYLWRIENDLEDGEPIWGLRIEGYRHRARQILTRDVGWKVDESDALAQIARLKSTLRAAGLKPEVVEDIAAGR